MKKLEIGEKRPLSPGYTVDQNAKQAESDLIEEKTAVFLANKGEVQEVEFGTMKGDTKGHTALRIKIPFIPSLASGLETPYSRHPCPIASFYSPYSSPSQCFSSNKAKKK